MTENGDTMRLQRYLAECGVASRRASEELIKSGKVYVNGERITTLGVKVDGLRDKITIGGKIIKPVDRGIVLLHKPRNVVCTKRDPESRPTVMDYLTKNYQSFFPVGRLDFDSSGLVILTNDGDLADRLLHPRYEVERAYRVSVAGIVSDESVKRLERGIRLTDGMVKAKVNRIERRPTRTNLELSVWEGKNRMVRRMFDVIRHRVWELHRISHGPFKIGKLKSGEVRLLKDKDYQLLRSKVMGKQSSSSANKQRAPGRSVRKGGYKTL